VFDVRNQIIGRLLVLRDVTEEKLLMDYRDEISNMIIHDLRSPLSAIYSGLSYSRILLDDPEEAPPLDVLIPVLDVAVNSTNNLLALVDSLLDIAKLESRSMPLKLTATSIPEMVNDAVATMSVLFKEAEINAQISFPEDLPLVYVDESKVRRVILNLLDNAQRFSPLGGVILVEAVQINDQKVQIRIADSGKGIPPEERERVFDKFRQVSNSSPTRGRRGSGLGLTFCKLVIEAHGEEIWVEQVSSLPGASFTFTLPVYNPDDLPENPA
jgi:signal transduction histidine kinase